VFVLSWILSGWLSMDHGRIFSRGQATSEQAMRYAGVPLGRAFVGIDPAIVQHVGAAAEIGFSVVGGVPLVTAWRSDGRAGSYTGAGRPFLGDSDILRIAAAGVASGWPAATARPTIAPARLNTLYALAEGWPASAVRLSDPRGARPDVYVDSIDGRILTVMDGSRKAYAWLYYGLHTFNFPGLIDHPLLRRILVLVPLLLGFLFSVTGVVIGVQRLRRTV
jgi:hypothetical protein